jgi:hypothetical protein
MIVDLLRGLVHWLLGLIESVTVVAAILLIGVVIGVAGFWFLSRSVRKLAGPVDPLENEPDDDLGEEIVSIQRDDDSPPSDFRA